MDWPRLQVSRGQSEHLCCCSESSTEAIFLQSSPLASRCLVTRWWKTLMVCPNLLSVKKKQKPDSVSFPLAENQMKQLKGIFSRSKRRLTLNSYWTGAPMSSTDFMSRSPFELFPSDTSEGRAILMDKDTPSCWILRLLHQSFKSSFK